MSRIPATTKLVTENFPEQRSWIGPMFSIINKFIQDVVGAVNGGLEFQTNFYGKEIDLDFVYVSAALSLPSITWDLKSPPRALSVVSAYDNTPTTNRAFSPIILNLGWQLNQDNQVEISDVVQLSSSGGISGLTVGKRYKIKVRITP